MTSKLRDRRRSDLLLRAQRVPRLRRGPRHPVRPEHHGPEHDRGRAALVHRHHLGPSAVQLDADPRLPDHARSQRRVGLGHEAGADAQGRGRHERPRHRRRRRYLRHRLPVALRRRRAQRGHGLRVPRQRGLHEHRRAEVGLDPVSGSTASTPGGKPIAQEEHRRDHGGPPSALRGHRDRRLSGRIRPQGGQGPGHEGHALHRVLTPCLAGWGIPDDAAVRVSRLAVETGFFPLYEVEDGALHHQSSRGHPAVARLSRAAGTLPASRRGRHRPVAGRSRRQLGAAAAARAGQSSHAGGGGGWKRRPALASGRCDGAYRDDLVFESPRPRCPPSRT